MACPLLPPEPWYRPGQGLALGTLAFSPGHTQWSCSARVCPLPLCLARMLSSLLASLPVPYHVSWSAWEASFPSLIDLSLTTRAEQSVPLPPCLAIALVRIAFLGSKACTDVPRAAFVFDHPRYNLASEQTICLCNCSGARQPVTSSRADPAKSKGMMEQRVWSVVARRRICVW